MHKGMNRWIAENQSQKQKVQTNLISSTLRSSKTIYDAVDTF